jgi:hypothetical protein
LKKTKKGIWIRQKIKRKGEPLGNTIFLFLTKARATSVRLKITPSVSINRGFLAIPVHNPPPRKIIKRIK